MARTKAKAITWRRAKARALEGHLTGHLTHLGLGLNQILGLGVDMMYLATRTLVPWWSLKLTNSLQDLEELHWHLQTYGSQRLYLQGLHHSRPDQRPSKP